MTLVYLDSSITVRAVLDVPERARLRAWLDSAETTFVSSRLLRTEMIRVLRREDRPLSDADPVLDRVGLIDITRDVHAVAESIERHIRTLDALHIATALLVGDNITMATHDSAMKAVAQSAGLEVNDPVAAL
ncbi:MAG: type II toxin-antitoxin system VapC family toxin [Actinomycetia bacterium]|nr:type II toxin-antitoxin system VapC family toxin [Actinomycetes bacterium]